MCWLGTLEGSVSRLTLMGGKGAERHRNIVNQLFLPTVHGNGKTEVGSVVTNADRL